MPNVHQRGLTSSTRAASSHTPTHNIHLLQHEQGLSHSQTPETHPAMCPAPHKAATAAARHCFTGQFPPPRPRARRTPRVPPQGPGAHGRPQRGQTGPATARLHSGRAGERPPGIAGTEGRRVRGAGPRRAGRVGSGPAARAG